MARILRLSRNQLSSFLTDQEQIRAFEQLFARSLPSYGNFSSSAGQSASAVNTATPITFDPASLFYGMALVGGSTSQIQVTDDGVYQISASIVIGNPTSISGTVSMWVRRNGSDVAGTVASTIVQSIDDQAGLSVNVAIEVLADDQIEILWSTTNTALTILNLPAAPPVPAGSSVTVSISFVGSLP